MDVTVGEGSEVCVGVGLGVADAEGFAVGVEDWVGVRLAVMVGNGVKVGYAVAVFNGGMVVARVTVGVDVFKPAAFCAVRAA